jgi:hypothetical protein
MLKGSTFTSLMESCCTAGILTCGTGPGKSETEDLHRHGPPAFPPVDVCVRQKQLRILLLVLQLGRHDSELWPVPVTRLRSNQP